MRLHTKTNDSRHLHGNGSLYISYYAFNNWESVEYKSVKFHLEGEPAEDLLLRGGNIFWTEAKNLRLWSSK